MKKTGNDLRGEELEPNKRLVGDIYRYQMAGL